MHTKVLLSSLLLTGCFINTGGGGGSDGDISGGWYGELNCDGAEFAEFGMDLDHTEGDRFEGDFAFYILVSDDYTLEVLAQGFVEIETDGDEIQTLPHTAWVDDLECALWDGMTLLSDDCDEMGIEFSAGVSGLGDLTWNGEDTIVMDDGDCRGDLHR